MHYFPAALQELTDQFARLPGIGGKTAQRLAFHVLELPLEDAQAFADAIHTRIAHHIAYSKYLEFHNHPNRIILLCDDPNISTRTLTVC